MSNFKRYLTRHTSIGYLLAGCIALSVASAASVSRADAFAVSSAPPAPATSTMQVGLYPDSSTDLYGTLGPDELSGAVDATVSVSQDAGSPWTAGAGNGSFDFNSATLSVADETTTITLATFGTVDVILNDVSMNVTSAGGIPVVGNQWNLSTIGAPSSLLISLNAGTMTLDNATGTAAFFVTTPTVIDLATTPVNITLAQLVAAGVGGTADSQSISMVMSDVSIPAFINAGGLYLDGVMSTSLYVATPEPHSFAILALGLLGLVSLRSRIRRK